MLVRALILPQRRNAGFYCYYHCCQLSYSLCRDRSCHANWPPVSLAPVSAPKPTRFLNSIGYFSLATLPFIGMPLFGDAEAVTSPVPSWHAEEAGHTRR